MTVRPSGIIYAGLLPGTGYGNAAGDYLTLLHEHGQHVQWAPLQFGSPVWGRDYYAAPPSTALPSSIANSHLSAAQVDPSVALLHTPREFWSKLRAEYPARRTLAYTTFEQTILPEITVDMLNALDGVVVPSRFNFDSFRASGVTIPMWVIPHLVPTANVAERASLHGIAPLPEGIGPETFVVSIFGPWQARKAIAESIEAFLRAFGPDDDVLLVVKTSSHDYLKRRPTAISIAEMLGRYGRVPRIHLITQDLPYRQVRALLQRSDCSLSLTRGEGFGLTIAESIAMGTPAIVTGWGAQLEFLGPDYALLVDHQMVAVASEPTDRWAETTGDWAKADIDHAVALLRWVRDHRSEARDIAAKAQRQLALTCSVKPVISAWLDALDQD